MRLFEGTQFDMPPKCDRCGELESTCECPPLPQEQVPNEKQILKVAVEKRKKGKVVTVVRGLAPENDHSDLLTTLKNQCGAGGTVKENSIEIQGDHLERLSTKIRELGFRLQGRKKS